MYGYGWPLPMPSWTVLMANHVRVGRSSGKTRRHQGNDEFSS
jgi:hypothetical protein